MEQPKKIIKVICAECNRPMIICPICINEEEEKVMIVTHNRMILSKHYQDKHPEATMPEPVEDLD